MRRKPSLSPTAGPTAIALTRVVTDGRWALGRGSHLAGVATDVEPGLCRSHNPRWSRLPDGRLPLLQELHKLGTAAGSLPVRETQQRFGAGAWLLLRGNAKDTDRVFGDSTRRHDLPGAAFPTALAPRGASEACVGPARARPMMRRRSCAPERPYPMGVIPPSPKESPTRALAGQRKQSCERQQGRARSALRATGHRGRGSTSRTTRRLGFDARPVPS